MMAEENEVALVVPSDNTAPLELWVHRVQSSENSTDWEAESSCEAIQNDLRTVSCSPTMALKKKTNNAIKGNLRQLSENMPVQAVRNVFNSLNQERPRKERQLQKKKKKKKKKDSTIVHHCLGSTSCQVQSCYRDFRTTIRDNNTTRYNYTWAILGTYTNCFRWPKTGQLEVSCRSVRQMGNDKGVWVKEVKAINFDFCLRKKERK